MINKDTGAEPNLLAGMLSTVSAILDCRRRAFFERTVTMTTVRMAGHDLGVGHLVWAT